MLDQNTKLLLLRYLCVGEAVVNALNAVGIRVNMHTMEGAGHL